MSENINQQFELAANRLMNGDAGSAVQLYEELLKKDDKLAMAWANRAVALLNLGHPFDSILNLDRAIALKPDVAEYYSNKGVCFYEMGKVDEAETQYNKAIELKPEFAEPYNNLGNVYRHKRDYGAALRAYAEAAKIRPEWADPNLGLSFVQLSLGDYENGWKGFEWRWKVGQMPSRGLQIPEWNGEDLTGKTLLIYGEQGFGDALQFVRLATTVKNKFGGRIIVEVRQPLVRLTKTVAGVDEVITFGEKIPDNVDYCIAMMSIPRIIGLTLETVPAEVPYFKIDYNRVAMWKEKLKALPPGKLVGVCWAGMFRASNPAAAAADIKRSLPLASLAPLAAIKGLSWVSLQKGPPSEQVKSPPQGMTIGDWTDEIDDFSDTAALIECLDLVITVDTSVLHVAGALGKPTWMLQRWTPCWRWLNGQENNPWYPTVRQFQQKAPDDWDSAVNLCAEALSEFASK